MDNVIDWSTQRSFAGYKLLTGRSTTRSLWAALETEVQDLSWLPVAQYPGERTDQSEPSVAEPIWLSVFNTGKTGDLLWQTEYPTVSTRFIEVLARLGIANLEYLPVKIQPKRGDPIGGFHLLRVCEIKDDAEVREYPPGCPDGYSLDVSARVFEALISGGVDQFLVEDSGDEWAQFKAFGLAQAQEEERAARWLTELTPLSAELRSRMEESFLRITDEAGPIMSIGLCIDDPLERVSVVALTESHWDATFSDERLEVQVVSAWDPQMWDLSEQSQQLTKLLERTKTMRDSIAAEDWNDFARVFKRWMVDGLRELVDDGWFERNYPEARIVFRGVGSEEQVFDSLYWLEQLNESDELGIVEDRFVNGYRES